MCEVSEVRFHGKIQGIAWEAEGEKEGVAVLSEFIGTEGVNDGLTA
jgi:hypothetical protein